MSDANDREEIDALAGEYVLGTLGAPERQAAEERIQSDPAFSRAVAAWAQRLQPLADSAEPVTPSPDLFHRVVARLVTADDVTNIATSNVAMLQASISRWRVTAGVLATAAIALFAVAIGDRMVPSVNPHELVAVLTTTDAKPAFIATIGLDAQTLKVRRLGDPAPADRSYELWAIPPGAAPQSLGVVEQATYSHDIGDLDLSGVVLAVSVEPKGGSTTGAPTGPVVFTGPLIAGN